MTWIMVFFQSLVGIVIGLIFLIIIIGLFQDFFWDVLNDIRDSWNEFKNNRRGE